VKAERPRAYTLIELMLVVGILVLISALIVPNFMRQIKADVLPRSARQLRSLLTMVRAHAAFDTKRYRIRFPEDDELDLEGGDTQPLIEREDDPIREPEVFNRVTDFWAIGKTLLGETWCVEVRMGRPTIEDLQERRTRVAQKIDTELSKLFENEEVEFVAERLPLYIEPDGTNEWAVFILTTAPRETEFNEINDFESLHLIVDGMSGLAWMQRPFYDEELDLFEENHWPAVLRQDLLDPRVLTENDVLELRESQVRGREVELKGRELEDKDVVEP